MRRVNVNYKLYLSTCRNSLGTIASNNSDATIADGVELGMDEAAAVQRKLLAEEDVRPTVVLSMLFLFSFYRLSTI